MEHQRQTLAEQFIDALHQLEGQDRDVDTIVALFTDDARLTNSALALTGGERSGKDGIRQFWQEYRNLFDQVRSDFHQVMANDQSAGLFWTSTGTTSDGQPIEYDGASLLVFQEDGKIAQFRGYYDTRQMTKQVKPGT